MDEYYQAAPPLARTDSRGSNTARKGRNGLRIILEEQSNAVQRSRGYTLPHQFYSPVAATRYQPGAGGGAPDNQTSGASTSAAIASPTLYTNRNATKRFTPSHLAESPDGEDHDQSAVPDSHGHNEYAGSELAARVSSSTVNGFSNDTFGGPRRRIASSGATSVSTGPTPALAWLRRGSLSASQNRRKRSSPPPSLPQNAAELKPRRTSKILSRSRVLLLLAVLAFLVYYLRRRPSTQLLDATVSRLPVPPDDQTPRIQLPLRKWWDPPEPDDILVKTKGPGKKRTSFLPPRHDYSELRNLPSRYSIRTSLTGASPATGNLSNSPEENTLPTLTVLLDCASGIFDSLPQIFLSSVAGVQAVDALSAGLSNGTIIPEEIRIAVVDSAQGLEGALDSLQMAKSRITLHPLTSFRDARYILSSSVLQDLRTDFLLLFECPLLDNAPPDATAGLAERLANVLHVAGTDAYSPYVLATSGLRLPKLGSSVQSRVKAHPRTDLAESDLLDIPTSSVLFQTSWIESLASQLYSLDDDDDAVAEMPDFVVSLSLASQLAMLLRRHLKIKTFGLPVQSGPDRSHAGLNSIERAQQVVEQAAPSQVQAFLGMRTAAEAADARGNTELGGAARVAFYLTPEQEQSLSEEMQALVCRFANEQNLGHDVRLFAATADILTVPADCPDVVLESLERHEIVYWSPHLCLATSERALPANANCTKIVIPEQEMAHADWMASLSLESLQNWHTPKIDLVVITNDRPRSLHRLLSSLRSAFYLGDQVNLFINLEQTADALTSAMAQDSEWPFGSLVARRRILLGGLMPSIVESWYPANNDTYGVFLEDDVEVSPLFYSWLKFTILQYRYGPTSTRQKARIMLGVSLYQPKNLELRPEGRRKFDAHKTFADLGISPETVSYLSQVPCSWGAVYFPEHWREFHQFLSLRLSEASLDLDEHIVPEIRSNRWYKSWKKYMIELMYLRGYSMLYPNYEGFRSLSTNHLELGTHVKDDAIARKRREAFEVPLLTSSDSILEGLHELRLPDLASAPILDFWGSLVTQDELVQRSHVTLSELGLCPEDVEPRGEYSLMQKTTSSRYDAAELLCARQIATAEMADVATEPAATGLGTLSLEERESDLQRREADVLARETRLAEIEARAFAILATAAKVEQGDEGDEAIIDDIPVDAELDLNDLMLLERV